MRLRMMLFAGTFLWFSNQVSVHCGKVELRSVKGQQLLLQIIHSDKQCCQLWQIHVKLR